MLANWLILNEYFTPSKSSKLITRSLLAENGSQKRTKMLSTLRKSVRHSPEAVDV